MAGALGRRLVFAVCLAFAGAGVLLPSSARAAGDDATRHDSPPILRVKVTEGCATWDLPSAQPGSQTLVVVSAMARAPGPFRIRLAASGTTDPQPVPIEFAPEPRPTRPLPDAPDKAGTVLDIAPARERVFHLMIREGDPASASNYLPVRATLRAVSRNVQVYVDGRDSEQVSDETVNDAVGTFESQVLPTARKLWGTARDVDQDRRFTILFTGWLARVGGGGQAVDGCFRGADLDDRMEPPFGNRCDMIYLNARLTPGPHLRTVLAHEYAHAVTFSLKTLPRDGLRGPEEENWLDEAIAHVVEDLHGFSRSNLDDRVAAFLAAPESYRLVVEDYYTASLFRSQGHRGSTYLFLRWCCDQRGMEPLLSALIRSRLAGIANLEEATGEPFSELFRRWSVDLFLRCPAHGAESPVGDMGPRCVMMTPQSPPDVWDASGTSTHFIVIRRMTSDPARCLVEGPPAADLQVTMVPLPSSLPALHLTVRAAADAPEDSGLQLVLREESGQPVELDAVNWVTTAEGPSSASGVQHHGRLDRNDLTRLFGTVTLPARGRLVSASVPAGVIPPDARTVQFQVAGHDHLGRLVGAWAQGPNRVDGVEDSPD